MNLAASDRQRRRRQAGLLGIGLLAVIAPPAWADTAPLMRYSNASATTVAFVARGDLWIAPLAGGAATRLTDDPGAVLFPRFSPDGRWIAFTARRAGTFDVYVMPASGGGAKRLTFDASPSGSDNRVVAWTPDSRQIVFLSSRLSPSSKIVRAFSVPLGGGLRQALPLDHSGLMSFSPDGRSIAFNRIYRNDALPKRYVGGQAQDIDTYDFRTRRLDRITGWKGTDTAPMWFNRTIYFLSDRGPGFRANIWAYDLDRRTVVQVTRFADLDVDEPSLGGHTITFAQGGRLYALDLPSRALREVSVAVPDNGARTRPRLVPVGTQARVTDALGGVDYALSPDGGDLLVSARGDLFDVPAVGAALDLTNTPGADEDHPSWSPDGRAIAFETDADGEQRLAVRTMPGGTVHLLARAPAGYVFTPAWSPDGRLLAVADAGHGLWLVPVDGSAPRRIASDPQAAIRDAAFSPDGRWLAFSTMRPNRQRAIHLHALSGDRDVVVSDPMNSDRMPQFSADGRVLFFVSQRNELPLVSDRDEETIIATLDSDGIYAATLDPRDPSPLSAGTSFVPGTPPAPLHVDPGGLMARAVALPVAPAVVASLEVRGRRVFFETRPPQLIDGELPGQQAALHVFDLDTQADRPIATGLDNHSLSAAGGSVAFRRDDAWHIASTAPGIAGDAVPNLSGLRATVDPRREWAEMLQNAWRLDRDVFFSRAMNGNDWQAVHDAYAALLPHLGSEDDFCFLLGQMQGELGSSHTFLRHGARLDARAAVVTGRLGADLALDPASGRYRLARILRGDNSRAAFASPLAAPGLDLHDGDFLLAIDGHELEAPLDPDALLAGAGTRVALTVAPAADGPRRIVTVAPIADEQALRSFDRIERNRGRVDRLSGGRIGYVALTDFADQGWGEFVRQFYPQADKQGMILDVRWNRGGFTSQAVLAVLRRTLAGGFVNREGAVSSLPVAVPPRAMVTLLNWGSGSDGDQFPFYFRRYGLGPLVGTRSWGGVQGINAPWHLMDGTAITIPKDALADPGGHWIIENAGVAPDIAVDDRPDEAVTGQDRQLDAAVRVALDRVRRLPPLRPTAPPPPLPAYPVAGMVPPASFAGRPEPVGDADRGPAARNDKRGQVPKGLDRR